MVYFERSEFWHRTGYFSSQSWLPTPGLRVAGDRPTGGAHGWLKSAAGRAAGNELRTRKEHVSDRDAGFKQPLERCNLLTHWAFEYFDQTSIERYARRVEIDEIEANDCNLNISRYVSTAEEEVAVDLSVTHKELVEIEKQIQESTAKHNAFLKELGLSALPAPNK